MTSTSCHPIGSPVAVRGVIRYPHAKYAMCSAVTGAQWTTTAEVYPGNVRTAPHICNDAHFAGVRSTLDFALGPLGPLGKAG